jgi:hypothetical protein
MSWSCTPVVVPTVCCLSVQDVRMSLEDRLTGKKRALAVVERALEEDPAHQELSVAVLLQRSRAIMQAWQNIAHSNCRLLEAQHRLERQNRILEDAIRAQSKEPGYCMTLGHGLWINGSASSCCVEQGRLPPGTKPHQVVDAEEDRQLQQHLNKCAEVVLGGAYVPVVWSVSAKTAD